MIYKILPGRKYDKIVEVDYFGHNILGFRDRLSGVIYAPLNYKQPNKKHKLQWSAGGRELLGLDDGSK